MESSNDSSMEIENLRSEETEEPVKTEEQLVIEIKEKLIKDYSNKLTVNKNLIKDFGQLKTQQDIEAKVTRGSCIPKSKQWKKAGETLLCVSAAAFDAKEVEAGLDQGVGVSCLLDHLTPLQHVLSGAEGAPPKALQDTVEVLLKRGANPRSKPKLARNSRLP